MDACLIQLTQGQFAKVSPEDFERLSAYRWNAWWCKHTRSFYAMRHGRTGEPTKVRMHRQVLGLGLGDSIDVDHINHDTLDNRRPNLRTCSRSENCRNQGVRRNNKLGIKGVHQLPSGKFHAQIMLKGKKHPIGTFDTAEEAGDAYQKKAALLHGEYSFEHAMAWEGTL
jgi:HNH endonuclease